MRACGETMSKEETEHYSKWCELVASRKNGPDDNSGVQPLAGSKQIIVVKRSSVLN